MWVVFFYFKESIWDMKHFGMDMVLRITRDNNACTVCFGEYQDVF